MRTRCSVPFCNRTTSKKFCEWICSDHWRLTDRRLRKVMFRCRRIGRPKLANYIWDKLKGQAIERAGGLN